MNIITIFHSSGFFDPVCQMSNEVKEEISFGHTDHLHHKIKLISLTSLTVVKRSHQTIGFASVYKKNTTWHLFSQTYRDIKPNPCFDIKKSYSV